MSRRLNLLFFVLAVAPAIVIGALVYRYGVNVPYYDDWDNTVFVHMKYLTGTLTLDGLFYQANKHRPAVPRLILLASDVATHGNHRVEMFVSLLAVCITSINLYCLARMTIPQFALPLIAVANVFLFSTVQYENWFWGIQLLMFLPMTLFTTAAVVTYGNWRFKWKVACGIALWIASAFCFISGFFFWPMLLILQMFVAPTPRARIIAAAAWVMALAITAGLYFSNMGPVPAPAKPELILLYPKDAMVFFSSFFASAFRLRGMTWYQLSTLGTAIILFVLVPLARLIRDQSFLRQMLPWAALLGFALISGLAATSSRLSMGLPQSQTSRYTTLTVLVPIAGLFLWAIIIPRFSLSVRRGVIVLGAVILMLHLAASIQRVDDLKAVAAQRLAGRDALMQINLNDQDPRLSLLYPDLKRLKLLANDYSKCGGLPLLETQPAPR